MLHLLANINGCLVVNFLWYHFYLKDNCKQLNLSQLLLKQGYGHIVRCWKLRKSLILWCISRKYMGKNNHLATPRTFWHSI